ncbi:hypothetical protein TgHK011_007720 [Trichoderma gracile]|nr:hypothetical protein TgHK011_007720 [Trichoderma gracile]
MRLLVLHAAATSYPAIPYLHPPGLLRSFPFAADITWGPPEICMLAAVADIIVALTSSDGMARHHIPFSSPGYPSTALFCIQVREPSMSPSCTPCIQEGGLRGVLRASCSGGCFVFRLRVVSEDCYARPKCDKSLAYDKAISLSHA